MEHFRDGQHVWLRSLVGNAYLHADEDGRGVSLRANRASRSAAWRVQMYCEGGILVLLQGAAYGRYLSATEEPAQPGHSGLRAEQRDYDDPEATSITWQSVGYEDADDIMLLHVSSSDLRFLCANRHHDQWDWETGVTIDGLDNLSKRMHWVVQPIPWRDTVPLLPGPRKPAGFISVLLRRNVEEDQLRKLRYVRAGSDGRINEKNWVAFPFAGRSVCNLRNELAQRLGEEEEEFTMCVRAGRDALLSPLVVDLPISSDRLDIVVLMDESPAVQALRYPDVDATINIEKLK